MQSSAKAAKEAHRVLRPYSPISWYNCYRFRTMHFMSQDMNNLFYQNLRIIQKEQLHRWLQQYYANMDMLLFHHDNHAIQMEWNVPLRRNSSSNNNNNNNSNENDSTTTDENFRDFLETGDPYSNPDSISFVAKCQLPKGLVLSTELPIGYVNFEKYGQTLLVANQKIYHFVSVFSMFFLCVCVRILFIFALNFFFMFVAFGV